MSAPFLFWIPFLRWNNIFSPSFFPANNISDFPSIGIFNSAKRRRRRNIFSLAYFFVDSPGKPKEARKKICRKIREISSFPPSPLLARVCQSLAEFIANKYPIFFLSRISVRENAISKSRKNSIHFSSLGVNWNIIIFPWWKIVISYVKRQVGELFPIFTHLQSQPASFPPLAKGWREKTAHNSPNKALNKFAPTLHPLSLLVYLFVRLFLVARKYSPCLSLGCVVRGIKVGEEIRGFAVSLGITKKTNGKGMCVTPEIFWGEKRLWY